VTHETVITPCLIVGDDENDIRPHEPVGSASGSAQGASQPKEDKPSQFHLQFDFATASFT
jgi:hypothetical protein